MYFQVFLIIYMFIRIQRTRVHSLFDLPGMSEGLTFFLLFSNRLYPKIPATCFSNRCYFVWNRNKFNGTYLYSKKYNILIPIQVNLLADVICIRNERK